MKFNYTRGLIKKRYNYVWVWSLRCVKRYFLKMFSHNKIVYVFTFFIGFFIIIFVTMNPTFLKLSIFVSCFMVNIYFFMIFHQSAKKIKTTSPINKIPDITHYLSNNKLYGVLLKINLKSSKFTITSFLFFIF